MGGVVMENNGIKRVYAGEKTINMTRALGDLKLKEFGISPEPRFVCVTFQIFILNNIKVQAKNCRKAIQRMLV